MAFILRYGFNSTIGPLHHDMAIAQEYGHYTRIWSLYLDMVFIVGSPYLDMFFILGNGFYTAIWPLY